LQTSNGFLPGYNNFFVFKVYSNISVEYNGFIDVILSPVQG
jgi:hypothetical protein